MKAYITHDGELIAAFNIRGNQPLDADHWARVYADSIGYTVDPDCFNKPRHYIPCGGDFTVTVSTAKQGAFGASCWMERNYYLAATE